MKKPCFESGDFAPDNEFFMTYIHLRETQICRTTELPILGKHNIFVDLDRQGEVVGLEIIGRHMLRSTPAKALKKLSAKKKK